MIAEKLGAQVQFYSDRVDFYVVAGRYPSKPTHAVVEFVEHEEGAPLEPSFSIPMVAAQEFFEQLWAQGFRSKHDRGGADKLDAARTAHIADLRRAAKLDREPSA